MKSKLKRVALTGLALSMSNLAAGTQNPFRQDFDGNPLSGQMEYKPTDIKRYNSNKPSKKRAKVKLARKQKHRK